MKLKAKLDREVGNLGDVQYYVLKVETDKGVEFTFRLSCNDYRPIAELENGSLARLSHYEARDAMDLMARLINKEIA